MRSGREDSRTCPNNIQKYSEVLERITRGFPVQAHEIRRAFPPETSEEEFWLLQAAHQARLDNMGQEIQVRGIIEFSNYCRQDCLYCGLRRSNSKLTRYRMSPDQIVDAASNALSIHKFGTFVLQSGEDPGYSAEAIAGVVRAIKQMGPAVTLSVGQRPWEDYKLWREAGADRFLLKFETSDPVFFRKLKPATTLDERLHCLLDLRNLGYQIGTGIILGLPGQTQESVIGDLMLLRELDPEMVSIGPFIPHPDTPLGLYKNSDPTGSIRAVLWATALSRLMVPFAHMPATTALGVMGKGSMEWVGYWKKYARSGLKDLDRLNQPSCSARSSSIDFSWLESTQIWNDPRGLALSCGANVIMPDVTPKKFRESYEIYPGKTGSDGEELTTTVKAVKCMIEALGMSISPGRGDSPKPQFQHK